jgi:hypothetical protein
MTRKSTDFMGIDSSFPFDPLGKKRRRGTKRRRRAQRVFLEKPWEVEISQEAGAKRASFVLASRPWIFGPFLPLCPLRPLWLSFSIQP